MALALEEEVASTSEAQLEIQRENEIYPARRPYNGVSASLGELRLENLNLGGSGASRVASEGGVGVVGVSNDNLGKRSVVGEFYEHGFEPEFSFRIRFQKIGAGLENLGNTCYLNSVLQCLTYTEPFAAYLQSGKHKSTCRKVEFCAMCALQNHVMDALQSTGKILRPFHLVKNLRYISSNFRNSRQEDAHEYMVNLLESMHKCCLPYGVSSESPSAYEKSQVHKIFGGQLRSQVKCMQCSYCSNKFDPFLDLSLEIMKADSLRKALAHFTAVELLDGGERQYHCQRCEEKVTAFKQLTIHKAPYVLTIHLKRFDSSIHGEKLSKKVLYGPTLNLNPFVSDPHEGDYKYTLYGVLVHAGWTTYSGHYFCYVRTSAGMWYALDDNQVTKVSEKTVLSREAYMLFYVRDRTFGLKRAVEVVPKPDISSPAGNAATHLVERKPNAAVNETKHSCLQAGDDVFTNGHQKEPTQEPAKPLPSMDSKLPRDGDMKGNATNESARDSALGHVTVTDSGEVSGKSNTMNDSILKEAVGTTLVDNQNNGPKGLECCSSNVRLRKDGERFLKLPETKPVESLPSGTTVCCVQQETHADIITESSLYSSHEIEPKLKNPRKSSSAEGPYFGRNKLFFMSLRLPKNKQMRSKKRRLLSRKKIRRIIVDPNTDSNGPSTSEIFQAIGVCSNHRRKSKEFNPNMKIFIPESSNKGSLGFCSSEGDSDAKRKYAEATDIQKFSVDLLMARLKQTSVATWEDKNFPSKQVNEMEYNLKRNIGRLLDECDEDDCDKARRKKLKKSRRWFGAVEHKRPKER